MKYLTLVLLLCASRAFAWDCADNPAYWYLNVSGNECYHAGAAPTLPGYPASGANASASSSQTQTQGQLQAVGVSTHVSNTVSGGSATSGASTSNAQGGASSSSAQGGAGGSATSGASTATVTNSASAGPSSSTSSNDASNGNVSSYSDTYSAARIPVGTAFAAVGITTANCRFAEGLGVQTMPAGTSIGLSFKDHDCVRFQLAQFFYARGQDTAGNRITCQIAEVRKALGPDCEHVIGETRPAPVAAAVPDAVTHAELREVEKRIITHVTQK